MIRPLRGGRSGEFSRDDLSRNMNEEGKARGEIEEWPSCKLNVLTSRRRFLRARRECLPERILGTMVNVCEVGWPSCIRDGLEE